MDEKLLAELTDETGGLMEHLISRHALAKIQELPRIASNHEEAKNIIMKGTTIPAALYNGGGFIACERYATFQSGEVASPVTIKVAVLDEDLAAGAAGELSAIQELFKISEIEFYNALKKRDGKPLPLPTKIAKISAILKKFAPVALQGGPFATPLLVGYEQKEKRSKIFEVTPLGMVVDWTYRGYATIGSGRSALVVQKTVVDLVHKKHPTDLTRDEALDGLILYPLLHTYETDGASGFDMHRDVWPLVMEVTASGINPLEKEEVKERVLRIVSTLPKTRDERR
jgi:20S proteasome alpha/beta subunit